MSCCPSDVKRITKIVGDTVTTTYVNTAVSPPVTMTQAEFDALALVDCPITEPDKEKACLQPTGNTDAALIVSGWQICSITTTFSDTSGTVAAINVGSAVLILDDGTDVTATHEVVDCPDPIVIDEGFCVAAAKTAKTAKA